MPDIATAVPSFLSALRALPLWIILGLALGGYAVLFAPPFAGIDVVAFRHTWGVWVWVEALLFTALSVVGIVAKAIDIAARAISAHGGRKREQAARRILRLIPLERRSWHLAKQQDDSFISQIDFECQVTNTTDRPVELVKAQLTRPRSRQLDALLFPVGGVAFDSLIRPRGTVRLSIHILAQGALATQGRPIRVSVSVTDQFGEEYHLKNLTIGTYDTLAAIPRLSTKLRAWGNALAKASRIQGKPSELAPPAMPWTFEAGPSYLITCDSILSEEQRAYAARGRTRGQLGSLNAGLQSEPDFGATAVGKVPELLWPEARATPLASQNLARLLALRDSLVPQEKDNLERYLLCQLSARSPFSNVAYFVFLALHRMQRTADALTTARTCLAGDKVFGYSNLLGTLSALVSHEHFAIDDDLYTKLADAIRDDSEHDFRLKDKINLARLLHFDRSREDRLPAGDPTTAQQSAGGGGDRE